MKNKKLCVIIGIAALIIIGFVGYKVFLLYYFNVHKEIYYDKFTDISITRDITNQNEQIANLKFYLPSELGLEEKDSTNSQKIYAKYDNDGNQVGQFVIGIAEYNAFDDVKKVLKVTNYEKLAQKYNIKDEIDLYRYYYEHKDEKSNIFWSNSHIKMNGIANGYITLVSTGGPTCDNYFLNQDIKGVMVSCKGKRYWAYFVHENENYVMGYSGKEDAIISYQEFINILKSISFE